MGSGLTETVLLSQSYFQQAEKKRGVICGHTPLFRGAPADPLCQAVTIKQRLLPTLAHKWPTNALLPLEGN
jgi:hypothetical protein